MRAAVRHLSKEPARRCMSYAVAGGPRATRIRALSGTLRTGPSIARDAAFVRDPCHKFRPGRGERPGVGCWLFHTKHVARFKSTDGHRGAVGFLLRRLLTSCELWWLTTAPSSWTA